MAKNIKIRLYQLTEDGRWVCCCCMIIIAVLVTSIIMFVKSVEQIDWVYGRVLDTPQLISENCGDCHGDGVLTTKPSVNLDADGDFASVSASGTGDKNDHDPCETKGCFTVKVDYTYRVEDNSFPGQDFVDFNKDRAAAYLYIEHHPINSTVIIYFNTQEWSESSLSHMADNSGWFDIIIVSASCFFCCFLFYLIMCWKGWLGFIFQPVSLKGENNGERNNVARNYRTIYSTSASTDVSTSITPKRKTKSKTIETKKPDARTRLVHSV